MRVKRKNRGGRKRFFGVIYIAFILLLFCFGMIPSPAKAAESVYSVQTGRFSNFKNALRQYHTLEKSLAPDLLHDLRIEKKEQHYVVKLGRFDSLEKAEELRMAVQPFSKDAYSIKSPIIQENIRKIKKYSDLPEKKSEPAKLPLPSPPSREVQTKKNKEGSLTEKINLPLLNKSSFTGVIQEMVPIKSDSLGLLPGREIIRIQIRLEETAAIDGFPNILKEKEGQVLTLFSETNHEFFTPGNRLKGIAEYKGDHLSRMFWILNPQPLSL